MHTIKPILKRFISLTAIVQQFIIRTDFHIHYFSSLSSTIWYIDYPLHFQTSLILALSYWIGVDSLESLSTPLHYYYCYLFFLDYLITYNLYHGKKLLSLSFSGFWIFIHVESLVLYIKPTWWAFLIWNMLIFMAFRTFRLLIFALFNYFCFD
jgi:hypothetical protein